MWESQTILQDAGPTQHCQGVQQNPPLTLGRRLPECWCHHTKLPDPTGLRCSLTQLCPALWDPMGCSTPGFPVLHHLPEFAQTQVHWVGDAILLSHPLSPPSPALNLSQHQGLFQWVSSSHQVAKVLEFHLQHQSFQWIPRTDLL